MTAARKIQFYKKKEFGDNQNKALKRVLLEVCEQLKLEPEAEDGATFLNVSEEVEEENHELNSEDERELVDTENEGESME